MQNCFGQVSFTGKSYKEECSDKIMQNNILVKSAGNVMLCSVVLIISKIYNSHFYNFLHDLQFCYCFYESSQNSGSHSNIGPVETFTTFYLSE